MQSVTVLRASCPCFEFVGTVKTRCLPSLCGGCIAAAPSSYRCVVAFAAAATCKAQSASYGFHLCPQNSALMTEAGLRTVTPNPLSRFLTVLPIWAEQFIKQFLSLREFPGYRNGSHGIDSVLYRVELDHVCGIGIRI